jgi:tRNA-dihydrouridine synthase
MNVWKDVQRPIFILAPMYDVTDTVFRQVVADCAPPDIFYTEFVNADGLQSSGKDKLNFRLKFSKKDKPIIAQIWGKNPENFRQTAAELACMGYDGIDINFGCPEKSVVKNGCCVAMIDNRPLAAEIIQATREGSGKLPVSVKTRLGLNEIDLSWPEFLLQQNLDALTIHGRTRKEMSKVLAHWDEIGKVRALRDDLGVETLIIGNGDVESRADGLERAEKYQLDGIMIGRGIFADPFVFSENSPWGTFSPPQRIDLFRKHVQLFAETWKNNERPIVTLNKFCKIYINGFDGAKELREELMKVSNISELRVQLEKAVASVTVRPTS